MDKKIIEIAFLAILIGLTIYFIYLAASTQMLGEDEGAYEWAAKQFAVGKDQMTVGPVHSVLNAPFIPLVYAAFFLIFGASLAAAKAVTVVFGALAIVFVYLIGRKFSIWSGIISALLLFSISLFDHFSLLAYFDVPAAFFCALITYIFLNIAYSKPKIAFSIAVISLALYTKLSSLLLLVGILIYALYLYTTNLDKKFLKTFIFISVIAGILFLPGIFRIAQFNISRIHELSDIWGILQPQPAWLKAVTTTLSPAQVSLNTFTSAFGPLLSILAIFGFVYIIFNLKTSQNKGELFLIAIIPVLFILAFLYNQLTPGSMLMENRYLIIMFPQLALISALFLTKIKEKWSWSMALIGIILIFSLYSGITTAQATSTSQRYPADYISALNWIANNTTENDIVFTAYGGSLRHYTSRASIWSEIKEFPDVMTSQNGTYIYQTLKNYNISYVFVWRSTLAQNYIVPESNLIGATTYTFVNTISADQDHFNMTYSNQNNWILKMR